MGDPQLDLPAMGDSEPSSPTTEETFRPAFHNLPEFLTGSWVDSPHCADPESSPRSRRHYRHRKQSELFYRADDDDAIYLPELNSETRQGYIWHSTSKTGASLVPLFDEEPATFTIAGLVKQSGTCVQPHARYSQPSPSTPSLTDAQLKIRLTRPDWPFSRDFDEAMDTINWWIGQQCNKDIGWSVRGLTCGDAWRTPGQIKSLQLRHRLFEKVEAGDFPLLDTNFTRPHTKFSIAGWQVLPEAGDELESMIALRRHKVRPLPALDIHGVRILPEVCPEVIRDGALVEVGFSLHHSLDEGFRLDEFIGDIQSVRVLENAPRSEVVYSEM
ncbi:hypothetical protein V5O48_010763 [Marasmius crinis-equi]|uniref:Uncharacterized protein n=1 Tax=Marasmius crinis-equi TaxID=585013 RepID=A0ABR3F7F2_9AGAR